MSNQPTNASDHYAHHAVALAYGATREELAAHLRAMADHIARGGGDIVTQGAAGVLLVKQRNNGGGEEAMHQRMHMVVATEGYGGNPAIAIFRDRETAERFAAGKPLFDEGDGLDEDVGVCRLNIVGTWWNCIDPDPTEAGGR